LLAALAALLLAVVWLRPLEPMFRKSATTHRGVGERLPMSVLEPLGVTDPPLDLASLQGSVVLINLWGTWCPSCREELPRLVELAKQYEQREDFRLLAISCPAGFEQDLQELAASTAAFLEHSRLDVRAYADVGGKLRDGLQRVGAFEEMFPVTILVDRRGVIRAVWDGHAGQQELGQMVASLLVQR
jgi:cytochrome c biogenesis protein CcmG/thiol:disulfide interchange protein DsbE